MTLNCVISEQLISTFSRIEDQQSREHLALHIWRKMQLHYPLNPIFYFAYLWRFEFENEKLQPAQKRGCNISNVNKTKQQNLENFENVK